MAGIADREIAEVRASHYGREVRSPIVSAIEKWRDDGTDRIYDRFVPVVDEHNEAINHDIDVMNETFNQQIISNINSLEQEFNDTLASDGRLAADSHVKAHEIAAVSQLNRISYLPNPMEQRFNERIVSIQARNQSGDNYLFVLNRAND